MGICCSCLEPDISPGDVVELRNLRDERLNDKHGIVLKWIPNTHNRDGRWAIRLDNRDVAVKECNCRRMGHSNKWGLRVGDNVKVFGLRRATDLNGKYGKIVFWIQESCRWSVRLNLTGQIVAVSPSQLERETVNNTVTLPYCHNSQTNPIHLISNTEANPQRTCVGANGVDGALGGAFNTQGRSNAGTDNIAHQVGATASSIYGNNDNIPIAREVV